MEVPEFFPPPENLTAAVVHPLCEEWKGGSEVAIFHLASIFLVLGFMGGSGFYGLLYLFTFLTLGFFCTTIWSWSDACTTDTFLWNFALFGVCAVQVVHVAYVDKRHQQICHHKTKSLRPLRLTQFLFSWLYVETLVWHARSNILQTHLNVTFEKEFQDLYSYLFKKLGVSLTHFGKIVACCEGDIHTIEKDHCFAMEGKTAIDKLSVLLSGRIRVTVNGEFLHYIYPFQFLDSPEWDSLRPSEEGLFQVTLRADNCCRYVSWRRKKLYLLFAKHRYIAKVFALVVRNDIADKLYSLNDKAFDSRGFRYDLRLPTYCHVPPLPELDRTDAFLRVPAQYDHGHRARVPITITAPKETVS